MEIDIEFSDFEVQCIKNDIVNIEDWINKAVDGRINKCKKMLKNEWMPKLLDDPDIINIPANDEGFVNMVIKHKDYKDLETRNKESILVEAQQ